MNPPSLLASAALLVALVPVSALAVDHKLIAIADGHNGTHQVSATSTNINADFAEGPFATGRRIVLKFDVSSVSEQALRGAVLRLHGGRGLISPSPIDTRVFHFNFNQWNDSSPANIPYPSDSYCTYLASRNITDTSVNPAWQEFDMSAIRVSQECHVVKGVVRGKPPAGLSRRELWSASSPRAPTSSRPPLSPQLRAQRGAFVFARSQ